MLHSVLDSKNQDTVFTPIPHGHSRIILSTNIAESSVTIPGVRYVVDFGTHKEVEHDPRYRQESLRQTWISQSSAKQRAGRAGRLFPGHVFRLYSESLHNRMDAYDRPEMLRKSLASVILRLKSSCQSGNEAFRSAFHILQGSLQPPPLSTIAEAYKELIERGALQGSTRKIKGDFHDNTKITNLGHFIVSLPFDLRLGRMIAMSLVMNPAGAKYLAPAVVMAAAMSMQVHHS